MIETKKIKFYCGTGFTGVAHEEDIEFPITMTEEEIEAEFRTWVWERLDPYWVEIE